MEGPSVRDRTEILLGRVVELSGPMVRPSRRVVLIWRRSLRARVLVTTAVLAAVIVGGVAVFVLRTTGSGLVAGERRTALAEADAGLTYARTQLTPALADQVDSALGGVATELDDRSGVGTNGGLYDVLVLSTTGTLGGVYGGERVSPADIPASLRSRVVDQHVEAYAYVHVAGTPVLLVGAPLDTAIGPYELYYAFQLDAVTQTLDLVRTRLLGGGLVLVALLVGVVGLVTGQVLRPVRRAAEVAERLASGALGERMQTRGQDDLARLASSFNAMASSLQRQIQQLEELSVVQRRFTSDVSHELRTPLTTVRMAADLLHGQRAQFDPVATRSVELMQGQLDRFEALLGDLLEISRYDAHVAQLEAEPVDLGALVRADVEALRETPVGRMSEMRLDLPDEDVVADVDARRIHRVLSNLLLNALDHGEGRPLDVVLRQDADAVALVVRDHGVGLRPGEAALVFQRFWRADPSRARQTGGTGLGLSIAWEDTRLHGGWLQAWGEPGMGAAFRVTLPRRAGTPLSESPLPLAPPEEDEAPALPAARLALPAPLQPSAAFTPGSDRRPS